MVWDYEKTFNLSVDLIDKHETVNINDGLEVQFLYISPNIYYYENKKER